MASPELEALKALYEKQDLEELRELLDDEVYNMLERFTRALAIHGRLTPADRRIFVKHLHMMTFDETYRDAPAGKYRRTRQRIESLLVLCKDNEALLLREYALALDKHFPVESWSSYYVWNPKLVVKMLKSGKTRKSIRHHMSYRRHEEETRLELVEI